MTEFPYTQQMLVPHPWEGVPSRCAFDDVGWLKDLPDSVYLALWQRWPVHDLPVGYRSYIVSFHLEPVDCSWLTRQSQRIDSPIVVLHDGKCHDWPHEAHVHFIQYVYWHRQLEKMLEWFGPAPPGDHCPKYLASAYCSRITQSKMLIFTALAEYLGTDRCLLTLSNWLEEKNVHYRQACGNKVLDDLADIFWSRYFGQTIAHDTYMQNDNHHTFTANFHGPAYRDTAIHFTNESYHYSLMDYIQPGPFITEKTLKCIAGAQAFIPVGQFDTYGTLRGLGFRFDYDFDISWDNDPGNLTRLASIVQLIKHMHSMSTQDIIDATQDSNEHNNDHVYSGNFSKICQLLNELAIQKTFDIVN